MIDPMELEAFNQMNIFILSSNLSYVSLFSHPISLTGVVTADEALPRRGVVGEGAADEVLVEGALHLAVDLVLDVVDHRVEVPRVRVVGPLVRARQLA